MVDFTENLQRTDFFRIDCRSLTGTGRIRIGGDYSVESLLERLNFCRPLG